MEAHILISKKFTVLFCVFILLAFGCKKDGNDPGSTYRVTEWKGYYNDVVESHALFEYTGNKITLIQQENMRYNGLDSSKIQVGYPDEDSVELIYLHKDGSAWEQSGKEVLTYEGGKIIQYMDYELNSGSWEEYYKSTYNYVNANLSEEIDYYLESGDWMPNHKTTYQYNGNKLNEELSYNFQEDWKLDYKEMIYYTGDRLDSIVGYNNFSGLLIRDYKYSFDYEGNLIKTLSNYDYYDGDWNFDGSDSFLYDINGNLASMSEPDDPDVYRIDFIYQSGTGNYRDLFYYEDYLWYQMVPGPTKDAPCIRDFHGFGKRMNLDHH
jgi:hypothetical protein